MAYGSFQKLWPHLGSPYTKDHSLFGSILGLFFLENTHVVAFQIAMLQERVYMLICMYVTHVCMSI